MSVIIFEIIVVGTVIGAILAFNSFAFRAIINRVAFLGMDKDAVKKFVKSQTFSARFFITYIDFDLSKSDETGLAKWFLVWHRISLAAAVPTVILILIDISFELFFNQNLYIAFYVADFLVTYELIDYILGGIMLGAFPLSFLLALPVILRIRAERDDFLRPNKKTDRQPDTRDENEPIQNEERALSETQQLQDAPREIPPKTDFELRWSKGDRIFFLILGVLGVIFFIIALLITPILFERFISAFLFGAFCLLSIFMSVYLIKKTKRWRVVVSGDAITVHKTFGTVREFTINDISTVTVSPNGFRLSVYAGKKRVIMASENMLNYDLLYNLLLEARKMDFLQAQEAESFIVRKNRWEIVFGIFMFLFFGWLVVSGTWLQEDSPGELFFSPLFLPVFLFYSIHCFRWRVTVAGDIFRVQRMFGTEKEYRIKEITKVNLKKSNTILHVGDKKIKISCEAVNFQALALRLKDEGISAHYRGKLTKY
jgi:hypothetical protein